MKTSLEEDGSLIASDQQAITSGSSIVVEYHSENAGRLDDGIYTLQAKATDKAGNEVTSDMVYSVNRWGSTWYASEDTRALLAAYYTGRAPELEIHEVNPTEVALADISIIHSGSDTRVLEEGDWHTIEQATGDGWHEYIYTIPASNFTADGIFAINFLSEDKVGNRSGNAAVKDDEMYEGDSSLDIEFMLDTTQPSVVITGVEQDGRYDEDQRSVRIDISDVTLKNASLYLNGATTPSASWVAEEIISNGGYVDYLIQASDERQSISVSVDDLAGNHFDTEVSNLLITANGWVQFVNNTPLFVGSVVGGVVLLSAGGVALYFLRSSVLTARAVSATGSQRIKRKGSAL
jgi:hypothetical protein